MAASLALVGVSLSAVVVALLIVVAARRAAPASGTMTARASGADQGAGPGAGEGDRTAGAVPGTVQIALDSVPQGATVALVGAGSTPGEPLGQTPLLVSLARGEAAVEVLLTKAGFAPLSFRVIANRDKDATAVLEHENPVQVATLTTTTMAAATTEDEPRPRRKRSRKAHADAQASGTPTAPAPAPAAPVRPAAKDAPLFPRTALPTTQAPVPGPHR